MPATTTATAAQLIQFLQQYPGDTEVRVQVQQKSGPVAVAIQSGCVQERSSEQTILLVGADAAFLVDSINLDELGSIEQFDY